MMLCVLFVLATQIQAVVTFKGNIIQSQEQNIIDHIFNEYHTPFVRPIKRREDKIVVYVGLTYHQLIDVNEKDQILTSSIWIRQNWTNQKMTWDKEKFGNITTININPKRIWKPDLYLYNNADENSDGGQHSFNTKVKLSSNGENLWLAPNIIKTACKINVEHFPFDEQSCEVKLGSWTYDTMRLDVQLEDERADTSKFVSNGEWDLISITGNRNQFKYPCCAEPYADLTYTIRIRRRTRFYYVNLIIPCFVITGLSILAFKVPPDSGERITLVITNLLSMIVFLLLVADILPPISDATPLISVYYAIVMFEIGFALICTCVVLKVNFKHPSHGDMPDWFRKLVLHRMAKLFRMTPQVEMAESQKKHFNKAKRKTSIFATWIPRFSLARRFSSPRGSEAVGETHKSKRKQSRREVEKNEDVDKLDESCEETINRNEEDKYIALTEITVQDEGAMLSNNEDTSLPQGDPFDSPHGDHLGSPGTSGENTTPVPNISVNPLPESEHPEALRGERSGNIDGSPNHLTTKCLACSHNGAIHSLVMQQENLVKHVESLADMARDMEEEEIKKEEWKLAAAVLDEFFFWLYLVMLIVSNAAVFSMIPQYDD